MKTKSDAILKLSGMATWEIESLVVEKQCLPDKMFSDEWMGLLILLDLSDMRRVLSKRYQKESEGE